MIQDIKIVKYREIPNKFCLTSRFILKIMLVVKFIFIIINFFGYSIYLFDIPQYKITYIYDLIILILGIASFSLVHKWKFIPISILAFLIAVAYGSSVITYNENTIYKEYVSPDNKVLVTKSSGYLFSGKTYFYIKNGFILKNTNVTIELDDGYQKLRNAETEIIWSDELIQISYYDENNNLLLSKEIQI